VVVFRLDSKSTKAEVKETDDVYMYSDEEDPDLYQFSGDDLPEVRQEIKQLL